MIFRDCDYFGSFYRHESMSVCVDALHELFHLKHHRPIDIQITKHPICKESVKISFIQERADEDMGDFYEIYEDEYCTTWYATSDRFTALSMTQESSRFLSRFFKNATKGVAYITVWKN